MFIAIIVTVIICFAISVGIFAMLMRKLKSFECFEDRDVEFTKKILIELDDEIKQEIKFNTEMKNRMTPNSEAWHYYKGKVSCATSAHQKIIKIYNKYFMD
jgi:hypothetical protein